MQVEPLTTRRRPRARRARPRAATSGPRPVTRVRPGHADLAGALKYGFNDVRNVLERASARETAARVAAGGVARAFLRELGIEVWSFTAEVGGVARRPGERHPVPRRGRRLARCAARTPTRRRAMIARIDEARSDGDTVGGVFEVVVHGAAHRARLVRPLGPPARRRARRGRHEHQHRQGRRDRARVRADAPLRLAGPRRDRGPRRGRPLDPPHRTTPAG